MNASAAAPKRDDIWPGFHFLRHLLSVIILSFHAYVLTFGGQGNIGYDKGRLIGATAELTTKQLVIESLRPGLFALVAMFFALSGFLVMGSALRTRNTRQFFTLRALRILPALCTEVTLSAFILGPLVTTLALGAYFGTGETYTYFGNIIGIIQYELPGVFTHNPMPNYVNVNLWTLHAEFFCYFLIGVLMITGLLYKPTSLTIMVVAGVVIAAIVEALPELGWPSRFETTHFQSWFLVLMFALGMLFALWKSFIPIKTWICAACGVGYFALMLTGVCDVLAGVLLTYVMVYLGACKFGWFDRLVKDDCSYGIYLYGYPITQTVVFLLHDRLADVSSFPRMMTVIVLSVGSTFAFALVSWRFVEKPFLRLKAVLLPRKPAAPATTYVPPLATPHAKAS